MTDPSASRADRWATVALLAPVLVSVGFNALHLWPELSIPIPSVNDDATHFLLIQRASEALAGGENLLDHWVPEFELGFPWFLYYQNVPHLAVVLLHRLLLGQVELLTLMNAIRFTLLVGFPLAVYWSMRRMAFSTVAAAVGAASASLLSANGRYGFEYGSYVWLGFGMFTQLWAMSLSFVTLACLDRLVTSGKGYVAAVMSFTLLVLVHLFEHLVDELADLLPRLGERLLTVRGDAVVLAHLPVDDAVLALQVAGGLEAVQQRVERPR